MCKTFILLVLFAAELEWKGLLMVVRAMTMTIINNNESQLDDIKRDLCSA